MAPRRGMPVILLAEDDEDDVLMITDALGESGVAHELRRVADGAQLIDYLTRRAAYAAPGSAPEPSLVLLDLDMPGMDGRQSLQAIRADRRLRRLPVVVFTTSGADEDVRASYDLGANSYLRKPPTYARLVEVLRATAAYWLEVAELPSRR